MPETLVITDTSCLIVLSKVGLLDILRQLYRQVVISTTIAEEYGEEIPEWIHVQTVINQTYQGLLEAILDPGESSAIALALEIEPDNVLLVIDELKGRKEAKRLGLRITGTLGVLYAAKQKGIIPFIKPYIIQLQTNGFRVSQTIIEELLLLSNE
jgi:predicted nucleic acid-binding protein